MSEQPIYVTQPFLPPLEEFVPYLERIWESHILTNGGPMHQQLEAALARYLHVPHVALCNNGMSALLVALQALDLKGEVITTPYSFVATTNAIVRSGLTPVFVDIDPHTLNLDPARIEAAITERTCAILPVHCYGNPCDTAAIQRIAEKHRLKVIYDAAHAFGVEDAGGSVLRHGDLSILSFHATKVFNTFEGGAIVCKDAETKRKIDEYKNFGIADEITVHVAGINGKMGEINAAFGLLQLRHMPYVLNRRAQIAQRYREGLSNIRGITVVPESGQTQSNHAYFPVLIEPNYQISRDTLYEKLKTNAIFARRYFYPLIADFPMYRGLPSGMRSRVPVAAVAAEKVLCLPIYPNLDDTEIERIANVIRKS